MKPVQCLNDCFCFYKQDTANILNCSSADLISPPETVPAHTEWIDFSHNKLTELNAKQDYFQNCSHLNMSRNNVKQLTESAVENLANSKLRFLDLSHNNLVEVPKSIKKLEAQIWLSGNPIICKCSMLWMVEWFNSGQVKDSKFVTCHKSGKLIKFLDSTSLGCFPMWQRIVVGITAALTVVVPLAIVAINRRWNELKWLAYYHFDILDKNDGQERLENKKRDAILSYR